MSMSQSAEIISFSSAFLHGSFLYKIKKAIQHSTHGYEQMAYSLICDLEEMVDNHTIERSEFALVIGKAAEILSYFRYEVEGLAQESTWYRASVIHQISCGMLQALRMLRPDLHDNCILGENAYHLYRYYWPFENNNPAPGPVKYKRW